MSAVFASGVVSAYVATVVGVHRFNLWRMRKAADGFRTLGRVDWNTLVDGVLPGPADAASRLPDGTPVPARLASSNDPRAVLLRQALFGGAPSPSDEALASAGFAGAEGRWARLLIDAVKAPGRAADRLNASKPATAAEVYLREHLALSSARIFEVEWVAFHSRRRLNEAIARFGERPALYFARARTAAMVGLNRKAIDDLGRAVYFSQMSPFYLAAVLDLPYIATARPPLAHQCRQAMAQTGEP